MWPIQSFFCANHSLPYKVYDVIGFRILLLSWKVIFNFIPIYEEILANNMSHQFDFGRFNHANIRALTAPIKHLSRL